MSIDRPDSLAAIEMSGKPYEVGVELGRFGAGVVTLSALYGLWRLWQKWRQR